MSFDKRYTVINRFIADKNRVRLGISSLSAGWDGTDYEQALRGAESLLGEIETTGPKRIVMISDFQMPGWTPGECDFQTRQTTRNSRRSTSAETIHRQTSRSQTSKRVALCLVRSISTISWSMSAISATRRSDHVQVDFQINDQTVEKREISLNSRDSRVVEFTGFNLNEGANRCTVDIVAGDFAPDNRFYFTLRRETPAKALIVESASRGRSDSLHLQSALTTNDDLPFTFTLKSAGSVDPASISDYALVVLNDAGPISSAPC